VRLSWPRLSGKEVSGVHHDTFQSVVSGVSGNNLICLLLSLCIGLGSRPAYPGCWHQQIWMDRPARASQVIQHNMCLTSLCLVPGLPATAAFLHQQSSGQQLSKNCLFFTWASLASNSECPTGGHNSVRPGTWFGWCILQEPGLDGATCIVAVTTALDYHTNLQSPVVTHPPIPP
jgi:hypothetical protein